MDPITGSVVAGLAGKVLGGLFGSGSSTPDYQTELYKRMTEIWDMQLNNYKNANLEVADAALMANYRKNATKMAGDMLSAFEGRRLSNGQTGENSEATRARAIISGDVATDAANLEASLDQSRLGRYNALMPNPAALQAGAGLAGNIDATNAGLNAGNNQLLGMLGSAVSGMDWGSMFGGGGRTAAAPSGFNMPVPYDVRNDKNIFKTVPIPR